jgi:N-acyl-D-amino-acid deacylase
MRTVRFIVLNVLLLLFVSSTLSFNLAGEDFDILIKNGKIVDGTGNPWFYNDIGIIGDKIVEIGNLTEKQAAKVINAEGLIVSPGFIDVHTHCGGALSNSKYNSLINYVTQGVTTVVVGNCGTGSPNIAEAKEQGEKLGIGINIAPLVGFGAIRSKVLGEENRPASLEELREMKALLRQAMEEGAWGMSIGLQYIPDRYASTEEIIEITDAIGEFDGIFTSHQRDEGERLIEAVQETIQIGQSTGVRINISHLKAAGKSSWGLMQKTVDLINDARTRGIEITADMYAYNKGGTVALGYIFNYPEDLLSEIWQKYKDRNAYYENFEDEIKKALGNKINRDRIRKRTVNGDPEEMNYVDMLGWHNFTIVNAKQNKSLIGKILSDLAEEQQRDAFDIAADLYIQEGANIKISLAAMNEQDMKLAMKQDWLMISSDGNSITGYLRGAAHPRNYGSFPRVFRKYVREDKILTLEQAVRKMTSLPAQFLRFKDRGLLVPGHKADIVIFVQDEIRDNATYINPFQFSTGIEYVLINGKTSIDNGEYNKSLNGKVLLHMKYE